jgi:hypothetical protein
MNQEVEMGRKERLEYYHERFKNGTVIALFKQNGLGHELSERGRVCRLAVETISA